MSSANVVANLAFSVVLGGVAAAAHRSKYEREPGYRPVRTMGAFAVVFSLSVAVIHLVSVSRGSAGPGIAPPAPVISSSALPALAGISSVPVPSW